MNILFCFIVKDGERYLQSKMNNIIKLGERFNKYKTSYAENDNTDSTKEILQYYKKINSNVSSIQQLLNKKYSTDLCKLKTRRFVYLKNKFFEQLIEKI